MQIRELVLGSVLSTAIAALAGFAPQSTKSDGIAQVKELARGFSLYAADWEETYPLAMGHATGVWMLYRSVEAPAGLLRETTEERKLADASVWVNSVASYWKSTDLLRIPDAPVKKLEAKLEDTLKNPWLVGFNYNGLLHQLPKSSVENPELVPAIWTGQGNVNREGFSSASPILKCGLVTDPCRFDPSLTKWEMRASLVRVEGPTAVFDGAMVFGMIDGSARRITPQLDRKSNPTSDDPNAGYNSSGTPSFYVTDRQGYPPLFRPDRKPKE